MAELDPLGNGGSNLAGASPAGGSESEVDGAVVPVDAIKRQLVMEEISRSGEMGGTTYKYAHPACCDMSCHVLIAPSGMHRETCMLLCRL